MTVKRVAKADMTTRGTVMAMARIGPAQVEWTGEEIKRTHHETKASLTSPTSNGGL